MREPIPVELGTTMFRVTAPVEFGQAHDGHSPAPAPADMNRNTTPAIRARTTKVFASTDRNYFRMNIVLSFLSQSKQIIVNENDQRTGQQ